MEIAVYLFTGFLESGKTTFIKETLDDERFASGERTLLLLCEEGEVELDANLLEKKNIFTEVIDDIEDINQDNLHSLCKKHRAVRVMIEYNGMWSLPVLYTNIPDNWIIYQEMTFSDAGTFMSYNSNMRNLVVEKLQNCELAVFNRCTEATDKAELHKIVRAVSRRCDIIYEYKNGEIEYDDIEDPLPFDIDAPVIEVGIRDYALWYRDLVEDMKKYNKKTVKFTGVISIDRRMPSDCFVIGRPIMTCCVEDITFKGIVCSGRKPQMENGDWIVLTAEIRIEKHKMYRGAGPVLYLKDYAVTSEPEEPTATFY